MREIDGSFKEGGGQVLRTALGLSCLLGEPFRIVNIRKGRKKPGLMPQHLAAVRAAKLISGAEVQGAAPGSSELVFTPGEISRRPLSLDIGTAGSVALVLQTIIPALVLPQPGRHRCCGTGIGDMGVEGTTVTIQGGTHVPFSPSCHYLREVFIPMLRRIGIEMHIAIETYGFYPKGGGRITAEVSSVSTIQPLYCPDRGRLTEISVVSAVGNLPRSIAERQLQALEKAVQTQGDGIDCPVDTQVLEVKTPGQGTFIFLKLESAHSIAGFSALGAKGKRAESVGEEAGRAFLDYYSAGAALDPYMSDQIVLYLSLCEQASVFSTSCVTDHLLTNLWVIQQFHDYRFVVEGEAGKPGTVRINF